MVSTMVHEAKLQAVEEPRSAASAFANQHHRRRAARLLDQQLWCWGQDIERTEGNLLVQFGFRKELPPEKASGSTAYILSPFPGCQLILWGFGLFFGLQSSGGMFLRRYGFSPVLSQASSFSEKAWCPDRLPNFRRPQSLDERALVDRLTGFAASWVAGYEHWVIGNTGLEYRRGCVSRWRKEPVVPAEDMATAWRHLVDEFLNA